MQTKQHKHEVISITTTYFNDKPAIVNETYCTDCGEDMPEVRKMFQDKENETFKAYGNKSPYIIKGIESVSERALMNANDPRLKNNE